MHTTDRVAVILPVYKNDICLYLAAAIDSILTQSYRESLCLYIGVDGPIGVELETCLKEYKDNDSIKLFYFQKNRGLAAVLNDLLQRCFDDGYEYIARMDADDISIPTRIEKQIQYLAAYPEIDVVGGSILEIDENGDSRGKIIVYPSDPQGCRSFFSKRNPHAHPAVLFRKRYFEKTRCLYRPEYRRNQDTMLWFDGMKNGTLHANIPDVVLKFRVTDSMFKNRRNGLSFAKKQLDDRKIINKVLGYGLDATIFSYMMYLLLISPVCIKKLAYKFFR